MTCRAIIFDVYNTLLEVGPSPADAAARWETLWKDRLAAPERLGLGEFTAACERAIAREHARARAHGIASPEVYWPAMVLEVLPELGSLAPERRADFLYAHAQLTHTLSLAPEAVQVLRQLESRRLWLGLASNAQPYTLRELAEAFAAAGLPQKLFEPALCFWSFEHGFSKPDPHVFRLLTARLAARGIAPADTLMVGDRLDNDIEPARAQGWRTWWLTDTAASGDTGPWPVLAQRLTRGGQK